jgi:hypothetical protein
LAGISDGRKTQIDAALLDDDIPFTLTADDALYAHRTTRRRIRRNERKARAWRRAMIFALVMFLIGFSISTAHDSSLAHKVQRNARQEAADTKASAAQLATSTRQLAERTAKQTRIVACQQANGVRKGARDFISSLAVNSERSNRATITSPFPTAAQKTAAMLNLATIARSTVAADRTFADKPCS